MGERNFKSYTNGTSALKMPQWAVSPDQAKIIAFPGSRPSVVEVSTSQRARHAQQPQTAKGFLRTTLESSEMYCSLRYESMKGCPYNCFNEKAIAALSSGGALIALVSLLLGA